MPIILVYLHHLAGHHNNLSSSYKIWLSKTLTLLEALPEFQVLVGIKLVDVVV